MQEFSGTTGNRRTKIAISVLSILVWASGFSAAFALNTHPVFFKRSLRNAPKTILLLPQTLPKETRTFRAFSASALRSIPSDLASNLSPLNMVMPVTLGSPDFEALAELGKELHCEVMGKVSFLVAKECNMTAVALAAPSKESVALSGTDSREIAAVGTNLSLVGGVMPSDLISSVLAVSAFPTKNIRTAFSAKVPRIAQAEMFPPRQTKGIVLGESITSEEVIVTERTISFFDRVSLSFFCALSKNVDEERCTYDALVKTSFTPPPEIPDTSSFTVPTIFASTTQTPTVETITTAETISAPILTPEPLPMRDPAPVSEPAPSSEPAPEAEPSA